jgi:hypothetical protein
MIFSTITLESQMPKAHGRLTLVNYDSGGPSWALGFWWGFVFGRA